MSSPTKSSKNSPSKRGASASRGGESPPKRSNASAEDQQCAAQSSDPGLVGVAPLPAADKELTDFLGEHVVQFQAYGKTPSFNYQYRNGLSYATIMIGTKNIANRSVEYLRSHGLKVVKRPCSADLDEDEFNYGFRNALDLSPCVLVLSDYDRLPAKFELMMPKKLDEMSKSGSFVPILCTTEERNFPLTDARNAFLRLKTLPEAESDGVV